MELLSQFAVGDLDAFEQLFRRFQGPVYSWIVRIVRDPATAEELTIETFWRIYRARARFDPSRDFGAWAHRIAINVALTYLRAAPQEAPLTSEVAVEDAPVDMHTQTAIRTAFGQLPERLQSVAMLALVEERPYGEVASILGITVSAVKSRMFRAVRLLRKTLTRLGVEA